ncbi:MAG: SLC13 family permease [Pseudohongiellaceae bacterium]
MTMEQVLAAVVVTALIAVLIQGRYSVAVVFSTAAFLFYASGLVDTDTLRRQLINPGVLTLGLLMLVAVVLNKSRALEYWTHRMLRGGYRFALAKLIVAVSLHSALLNNTAVVASLIGPVKNAGKDASRLLMPLAYAATLGGAMTLIGTSTNLLIDGFVQSEGMEGLHLLAPLPLGLVLLTVCGITMWLTLPHLLARVDISEPPAADYFIEGRVTQDSSLVGLTVAQAGLRELGSLYLVEIIRGEQLLAPVRPATVIRAEDLLVFAGDVTRLDLLADFDGLTVIEDASGIPTDNLLEVMVSGESVLRNRTIRSVDFRARFDAAVLAVRRSSRYLRSNLASLPLEPGDILVLATGPDFENRNNLQRNFIPVSRPIVGRFVAPWKSALALGGFALVIALAGFGAIELLKGLAVLLAVYMVGGLVKVNELRRNIPWYLLITIVSALVVSQVLASTGLASLIVSGALDTFSPGPHAAMIVILMMTALMTALMTNNAAAALMFPMAVSISSSLGVDVMPFVMAVLFGASASFMTPHGYQTNLMVMAPGGYTFRDYLRAGAPVTLVYLAVAGWLLPVFFPFG